MTPMHALWDHACEELGWVWQRCRGRLPSAIALSLAFKAVNLILLAPLAAAILRYCLVRWGRASVGNFELVAFFVSPVGLAALLGTGSILLASLYMEISGLVRLLAGGELRWWQAFAGSTRLLPRLVLLGLRQTALYVLWATPFLVAIAVVHWLLWSGKDINGLIILKPPEFWWGVLLAGLIAVAYGLLALWLLTGRIFAVPILTLETGTPVSVALRASVERARGGRLRCAGTLAAWAVAQGLLAFALMGLLHWLLWSALSKSGGTLWSVMLLTLAALTVQAIAAMFLSVLANVTFAAVVLSLYRQTAPAGALAAAPPAARALPRASFGWLVGTALVAIAVLAPAVSFLAIRDLELSEGLEITAHRAGAARAPENSVAALKLAIADSADWAEIDVQLTADKALVVMHDIDLARIGGGNRRVDQVTLAEIRALDIGAAGGLQFASSQFAGERVPTLQEILAAADGRIRLNVELKPHSRPDADELTRRVIAELRAADMLSRCRLCSQSYESLVLARQLAPTLKVGYIVATAVGDPAALDVHFLMVKSNLATRQLVDRARLRGISIHAWTVNDPAQVRPLVDAGVANLITDDPARIRAELDRIFALSAPERLLLRAHDAMTW